MFCSVLPWAGVEATSSLIPGAVADDVRGIDDPYGVYTLMAGLVVLGCGLAGLLSAFPRLAALAAVPAGVAMVTLLRFVTVGGGGSLRDRISFDLGGLLSIEPVLRFGWFAALGCALAAVVLSALALFRRA